MTADELEKSIAIELFRTDDPEGYQQYDAGILLVSFPGVYKELAKVAIKGCMEAVIATAKQHIGSAARNRRQRGQTFNTLPDHAVAEIEAEERGEDIAADIIRRELSKLIPEEQQ